MTMYAHNNPNSSAERAKREEEAWDDGMVWEENRKMFKKFHHIFNCPHTREVEKWQRDKMIAAMRGKRVLELGCFEGNGAQALLPFVGDYDYTGIDISSVAIEKARGLNLPNANFVAGDAANTGLPAENFDVVFGSAVLHHLPWQQSVLEVRRLLRPGGLAFFQEPLLGNPVSKIYRARTPKARTPDELPLTQKQIEWADRQFAFANHRYSPLVSMYLGAITSFLPMRSDNFILRFAKTIDLALEKTDLKYWMRYGYFIWQK